MVLAAYNSVITELREHSTPPFPTSVPHPSNGETEPTQSHQALAAGMGGRAFYLSAEQVAKAGGASCTPRGQGEECVAVLGRRGRGRWDLEGGAGLHRC